VKLKLDENIPASLKAELAAIGHDVHTVVSWKNDIAQKKPNEL
jgi:hypothetical protein